jgi:hypothetical protein
MAEWAVIDRPYSAALQLVVREMDETPQSGVAEPKLKVESDRCTHHANSPTGRPKSWRRYVIVPAILAPALKKRIDDDDDRHYFLQAVSEACGMTGWRVHASR